MDLYLTDQCVAVLKSHSCSKYTKVGPVNVSVEIYTLQNEPTFLFVNLLETYVTTLYFTME